MRRTRFEAFMDKKHAVRTAESAGQIADSIEVRKALMLRVRAGELTLEQAQSELKKIKRNAKNNGQVTRNQVWCRN